MSTDSTYYAMGTDVYGRSVGVYVEAKDISEAWDAAESRKGIDTISAVQLIFAPFESEGV